MDSAATVHGALFSWQYQGSPLLNQLKSRDVGLFSSKTLDLKEIEKTMRTTYKEMQDFSTQLVPGK